MITHYLKLFIYTLLIFYLIGVNVYTRGKIKSYPMGYVNQSHREFSEDKCGL